MQCFILAGGFATRLWPLTEKRAKPLLPLAGKPILTHLIERIPPHIPITISTNRAFERDFQKWKRESPRSDLTIIIEDTENDQKKIGTNGAIAKWIRNAAIEDDILLLTGDNYFGCPLENVMSAYHEGIPLIVAHDIGSRERAKTFGTVLLASDKRKVIGFEEKPPSPKTTLINTGCSILPRRTLPLICAYAKEHPDFVGGIFEELLRHALSIECAILPAMWFDIGSFDTYLEATKALVGDKCQYDKKISNIDKRTLDLRNGSVVVGANSQISDSTLTDSVVFEYCVVRNCVLERCIVDNHCILENIDLTGQMLREGTVLRRK